MCAMRQFGLVIRLNFESPVTEIGPGFKVFIIKAISLVQIFFQLNGFCALICKLLSLLISSSESATIVVCSITGLIIIIRSLLLRRLSTSDLIPWVWFRLGLGYCMYDNLMLFACAVVEMLGCTQAKQCNLCCLAELMPGCLPAIRLCLS